jgi:flagellar basal-body rod protein FlgB
MIGKIFGGTTIPVLNEAVQFAQARHEMLAGNIANLDTPGYQARDLSVESFQDRLREAIEARRERGAPISPGVGLEGPEGKPGPAAASLNDLLYHDQSNVTLERQVAEVSNNQYLHNVAIAVMTTQFRQMHAAISEQA